MLLFEHQTSSINNPYRRIIFLMNNESFFEVIKYDRGWSSPIKPDEFYDRFDPATNYHLIKSKEWFLIIFIQFSPIVQLIYWHFYAIIIFCKLIMQTPTAPRNPFFASFMNGIGLYVTKLIHNFITNNDTGY